MFKRIATITAGLAAAVAVVVPATAQAAYWRNVAHATAQGSWSYAYASADSLPHRAVRIQTVGYHTGTIKVDWDAYCFSGWNTNERTGSFKTTGGVHWHSISLPNGGDCSVDATVFLTNGGKLTLRIQQRSA